MVCRLLFIVSQNIRCFYEKQADNYFIKNAVKIYLKHYLA